MATKQELEFRRSVIAGKLENVRALAQKVKGDDQKANVGSLIGKFEAELASIDADIAKLS